PRGSIGLSQPSTQTLSGLGLGAGAARAGRAAKAANRHADKRDMAPSCPAVGVVPAMVAPPEVEGNLPVPRGVHADSPGAEGVRRQKGWGEHKAPPNPTRRGSSRQRSPAERPTRGNDTRRAEGPSSPTILHSIHT